MIKRFYYRTSFPLGQSMQMKYVRHNSWGSFVMDWTSILPKGEECSIVLSIIHVLCRKGILLQLNGCIALVSFFKTNIGALKITLTGAGGVGIPSPLC